MPFFRKITNALRSPFKNRSSPPLFLGQNPNLPPELDPHDPCRLYRNMKTGEVMRSLASLFPATVGPVVDLGTAMKRSKAVEKNLVARMAVMGAVNQTVYRQLRTSENAGEAAESLRLLWKRGMNGILDYGLQGVVNVAATGDVNFAGIVSGADGMENLRSSRQILETYPQSIPAAPPTLNRGEGEEEKRELHLSLERLAALCNRSSAADLPLRSLPRALASSALANRPTTSFTSSRPRFICPSKSPEHLVRPCSLPPRFLTRSHVRSFPPRLFARSLASSSFAGFVLRFVLAGICYVRFF